MPTDLEDRLAGIEARDEIRELPARYAWHSPRCELEEMVALFTEDCIFQSGSGEKQTYIEGRPALLAYFSKVLTQKGVRAPMITNMTVELLDSRTARSVCLMANPLVPSGSPPFVGYYLDDYAKVQDRWLFSARRFRFYSPESDLDGGRGR